MELTGNTILLTGGSSGIGLAFAKKFVALGNEVIITGRNMAKLEKAREIEPKLHIFQCDVSDLDAIDALSAHMRQNFPKLNVLMNNAGVFEFRNLTRREGRLENITEVDVNINGPIRVINALIELLKENHGTIINVSSGLALVPFHSAPIYSASKAALHSYTISLRLQLAEHGVDVVELMPPVVRTEMTSALYDADGITSITADALVNLSLGPLRKGVEEIRPGQSSAMYWMSRIAPKVIQRGLTKSSRAFIP